MVDAFVVQGVLVIALVVAVGFFLYFLLWRLKSAEDRKAFSDVLDEESVTTTLSPNEYLKAQARRKKKSSENSH